ncbi:MAG: type IV pilus assembly protein PilM [Bdellovibrionota bacterium]
MFFSSKKILGIDIGSSSIKFAELDVSKNSATLQSFGIVPTPGGSVGTGEVQDPNSLAAVLRGAVQQLKTKRKNISLGLWGTAVIVKRVTIPRMDKNLIKDQVRFEAEQYIPFDISTVALDYHLLNFKQGPETMDILLVGAQNDLIASYIEAIDAANLKTSIVDVSGFALANIFEFNYGVFPNTAIGILNFGATVTNFVVVFDGEVIFSRDIPVGGANFSHEISKGLGVSINEAESFKLNAVRSQEVPEEIHSIIASTNESLAEEIRNSLDFVNITSQGVQIQRCFFTGGSSATVGLIDTISRVTQLPFEPMNPTQKLKINSKKFPDEYMQQVLPLMSVALGLGLRQIGDR